MRKTVTVLFCDVVGSTELGERSDPEVLRGVMARFYAAARAPVERHGGRVEKVIGDALVAVFGIPACTRTTRSGRCGGARDARRRARDGRDAGPDRGQHRRCAGPRRHPGESLVVGDAVNVAARLEQAAAPGEVLVGEATWALVGHAGCGERARRSRQGQERAARRVAARGAWIPRRPGHRRRLDLPMIGREAELELLRWALGAPSRPRRPHLVTVLGQPGIGKSRLVAEVRRLRGGLTVLTGQCRATTAASSLEPLLEVARAASAGSGSAEASPS